MKISHERINELSTLLGDGLDNVIDEYLASSELTIKHLYDSLARNDNDSICRALHRLKGSSANLGLMSLSDACIRLETDIKNTGKIPEMVAVKHIDSLVHETWQQLEQHRNR